MSVAPSLSVVIITYNESRHIAACIQSVLGLADEILVVDSFSTDDTVAIAEGLGARVLQHEFKGHIEQKNWAKEQATHTFVLSLDADECLSEPLKNSILIEKQMGFHHSGYYMNRLNFIGDKPVKGCGWYPDQKLRLWNRELGSWSGINPHDRFKLRSGFPRMRLDGDLYHYSYANHRELFQKSMYYGKIGAKYTRTLSIVQLLGKLLVSPLFKFIRNYFFKGGISYGRTGLLICYCQLIESYIKYSRGIVLKLTRSKG